SATSASPGITAASSISPGRRSMPLRPGSPGCAAASTRSRQRTAHPPIAWRPPEAAIPPAIEALALERAAARRAKQWAESDRIRDALREAGWEIEDRPDGHTLKPRG